MRLKKLSAVTVSLLAIGLASSLPSPQQSDLRILDDRALFPAPDLMLYSYLSKLVGRELMSRTGALAELETPEDWAGRQKFIAGRVRSSVGSFPVKTPLRAKITGKFVGDGYSVERIIYESRPNFFVTANLYLPHPIARPVPAVISPIGHWNDGKANDIYRTAGVILALRGYAAFIFDPIGQGERLQYFSPDAGRSVVGGAIYSHNMVGKQCLLTDTNLTNYFLWDAIRGLDYLETRPDIDSSRLVCAGASGGGTQTEFLSLLDNRIKISIPVVSVGAAPSTKPVPYMGEIADSEQNLFQLLRYGVVQADWLGSLAPKPLFLIAASGDRNGMASHGEVFYEIRDLYRQFGADPFRVDELIYEGEHGWPDKTVVAACDWMDRWFGRKSKPVDLPVRPPPRDSLLCTDTGQVMTSLGGETVFTLLRKRAREIAPIAAKSLKTGELESFCRTIRTRIIKLAAYSGGEEVPRIKHLNKITRDKVVIDKIVYYPEPDIYIPALIFRPAGARGKLPGILYLPQGGGPIDGIAARSGEDWNSTVAYERGGKEHRANPGGLLESLAQTGCVVMAIDYRGIGETLVRPNSMDMSTTPFAAQNFGGEAGSCHLLLKAGRTLFGDRLLDAVAGLKVLAEAEGVDATRLAIAGRSMGGLMALYAAALAPEAQSVLVERSLASYRLLVGTPDYSFHINVFIPSVLGAYDLDDVAGLVAPRQLVFLNMVDQSRFRLSADSARSQYRTATSIYGLLGKAGALEFLTADSEDQVIQTYRTWVERIPR